MTDLIQRNRDLMPKTYDDKLKLANLLAKSGLIPKQLIGENCIYKIFAILSYGEEFGLSPFTAIRNITVIDGLPTMSADLIKSLILSSGDIEKYEEGFVGTRNTMSWGYRVYIKRKSVPVEVEAIFTLEDANRAGLLVKNNWKNYPQDMLRARATSKAGKMAMPEILSRVYTPEELYAGKDEIEMNDNDNIDKNNQYGIVIENKKEDIDITSIYKDIKIDNEIAENEANNAVFDKIKSEEVTVIDIDKNKIISSTQDEKPEKDKIIETLNQAKANLQSKIPDEVEEILKQKKYDIKKFKNSSNKTVNELIEIVSNLKEYSFYNDKIKLIKSREGFDKAKYYTKKIMNLSISIQEIKDFENFLDNYIALAGENNEA